MKPQILNTPWGRGEENIVRKLASFFDVNGGMDYVHFGRFRMKMSIAHKHEKTSKALRLRGFLVVATGLEPVTPSM